MQSSRYSSVWRSLAVAFGDGVAFGVGMKLTQPGSRQSAAPPEADTNPLLQRLEEMEKRLAELQHAPRALAPGERTVLPPQPFDQKVLEAVVNAVDARLKEHSSQVERQMAELQAKVTIELQTLHQQDRSIADGLQALIEDARRQNEESLAAVRNSAEGALRAMQEQLASASAQTRIEDVEKQFTAQIAAVRTTVETGRHSVQDQIATLRQDVTGLVASGTQVRCEALKDEFDAQIAGLHHDVAEVLSGQLEGFQQQLREDMQHATAPLRDAVNARDREVGELRERLAGSDEAMLDLLQGVGEICRRAAQRITAPSGPAPQSPHGQPDPDVAPAESKAAPPGGDLPDVAASSAEGPVPNDEVPGFAQSKPAARLWRVPLVSSVVLSSGVMLMRHFL